MNRADVLGLLPFGKTQFVTVDFSATPDADTVVPHTLDVVDYDSIRYWVVNQNAAGSIYRDQSATRRAWGPNYLILRADVASLQARLLLFTERT